ncbi:MAG: zf-TFIIB domain-containing protein [Polyangiaceae bacterium]
MSQGVPCPRCGFELVVRDVPEGKLGECGGCFGVWLDNRACQLLVSGELSDAAREAIRAIEAPPAPAAGRAQGYREPATSGGSMACPACRAPLQRYLTDEGRQGVRVQLDVCGSHGTWFDRGEAWTLLQAVQLKRLALDAELDSDARERSWDARERAWSGFVAGAAAGVATRAK